MKPIRTAIVTVFTLLVGLSLQAQTPFGPALVGGEKVILRTASNNQTVTLSQPETPNACYEWSGPNIQGDNNKPTITANPVSDVSVYQVRRISHCGVEEAKITVRLTDTLYIVSVTPKNCFNDGDLISPSDFDIVTYPEGYEHLVLFTPTVAVHHKVNTLAPPVGKHTLNFYVVHNGHTSSKDVEITVINENLTYSGTCPDLRNLKKKWDYAKKMLDGCDSLYDDFMEYLSAGMKICKPSISNNLEWGFSWPQISKYCCDGEERFSFHLATPALSGAAELDCQLPIPHLSVPGVGGLYGFAQFTVGIAIGPFTIHFRGKCTQADIPVELSGAGSLGLRLQAVSKDFLSGSLKGTLTGKTGFKWTIGDGIEWEGLDCSLKVVGEVKFLSLVSTSVEMTLWQGTFLKD